MDKHFLNQPCSWSGLWWLVDHSDQRRHGILNYDPQKGLSLTVGGSLGPFLADNVVIHGISNEQPITVFAFGVPDHPLLPDEENGQESYDYKYGVVTAVTGKHFISASEPEFEEAVLEIEHLGCLLPDTMAPLKLDSFDRGSLRDVFSREPLEGRFEQREYSLRHVWSGLFWPERHAGYTEVSLRDFPSITVRGTEKLSLNEVSRQAQVFRALVSFATDRRSGWLRVLVLGDREDTLRDYGYLYTHFSPLGDPGAHSAGPYGNLFDLDDKAFSDLVPAWLKTWGKFSSACGLLFSLRDMDRNFMEHRLLTAVTAAEAMCGVLGLDESLPANEFKRVKKCAVHAVPEEHRERIRGQIQNRVQLKRRLELLYDTLPAEIRDAIPLSGTSWAELSVKARNQVAHQGKIEIDLGLADAVIRVTEAIVFLILLQDLGFDAAVMLKAINRSRAFRDLKTAAMNYAEFSAYPAAQLALPVEQSQRG